MKDIETIQLEGFNYLNEKYGQNEIHNIAKLKGDERVSRIQDILREARLLNNVPSSRKDIRRAEELRIRGNDLYKLKKLKEALHLYTESLFTAPLDSPEYYLALSNRSAVLVHLSHHLLALKDAKAALEFIKNNPTVQSNLKNKLKTRIDNCERNVQENEDNKLPERCTSEQTKYFRLRDPQHPKIRCASDRLKLVCDEKWGRKVVAAFDLKPGHVIVVEKPYCHSIYSSERLIRCAQCLSSCVAPQPCPGCTQIGFCSEECRSASKWHNYECPISDRLFDMKIPQIHILALRIVTSARCDFPDWKALQKACDEEETKLNSTDVEITASYSSVHRLDTNENLRDSHELLNKGVTAAVLHHLLKTETDFFANLWNSKDAENLAARLILRHGMTVPTNAHTLSELDQDHLGNIVASELFGNGVYPFLSMFNHSCCPNAYLTDFGTFKVMKVLRPIKKDQQIFDNYGPHHGMVPKSSRQSRLQFQYKFTCQCQACSEDWPLFIKLPVLEYVCPELNEFNYEKLMKGDHILAQNIIEDLHEHAGALEKFGPTDVMARTQEYIKQCMSLIARFWGSKYIEE